RIKIAHAINETTPLDIGLMALLLRIAIESTPVPALQGNLTNTVLALVQIAPELLEVCGHGKTPAHADDGHRLRPHQLRCTLDRDGYGVHACRTGTPPAARLFPLRVVPHDNAPLLRARLQVRSQYRLVLGVEVMGQAG